LERIKRGADSSGPERRGEGSSLSTLQSESEADEERNTIVEEGRVNEHIGPVQFNMGGIQVDADDMLQRLKDRQSHETPEPETTRLTSPDGKSQNEALASFFAGLMKRGGGSTTSSTKPGGS